MDIQHLTTNAPLHWSISGLAIGFVVIMLLIIDGRPFGVSSSLRHLCALAIGDRVRYFDYDVSKHLWSLIFILGIAIGGGLASIGDADTVLKIGEKTTNYLEANHIPQTAGLFPQDLFQFSNPKGIILLVIGGLLIGFGTRYAQGCTSGHSIFGMANFHLSALIATISFFTGGLVMTHLVLPLIF